MTPQDDIESGRREWVALDRVPDLINKGEVRSANAVAALLFLHPASCASANAAAITARCRN